MLPFLHMKKSHQHPLLIFLVSQARYKQSLDPTVDEVKKLCTSLRRNAKEERVLFHYNGHGVPRPTVNGEIWVFNKVLLSFAGGINHKRRALLRFGQEKTGTKSTNTEATYSLYNELCYMLAAFMKP